MAAKPQQQMDVQQQNLLARRIVLQNAIDEWQNIFSQTYSSGILQGNVINIQLRNVGLVKRLLVQVAATISGSATTLNTLTKLGMANFFSQVVLTDLSNQQRINTTGWHLTAVASAKAAQPYGSAITATDTPFGYGNNFFRVNAAPTTISATAASNNCFAFFEIPLAYSDNDLRGAIYANVVNATFNLQLTVNPSMLIANTVTDPTLAVYQSSGAAATLSSYTITVYQNYLDQIPVGPNNGPVLPYLDLSTAYVLNNTVVSGFTANQDIPIPYANFRDFLSTTLIYDNAGVLNPGTDILNFKLQAANYTSIIQVDPFTQTLLNARKRMQCDMPSGTYYFDHRNKPISTVQYGNQQLVVNCTSVGANSQFLVGYEAMAIINQVTNAGSLYGN